MFNFTKNGSNGTRIQAAFHVEQPFDIYISRKSGTETVVNTASFAIEGLNSGGKPATFVMMDDEIVKVVKITQ